MVANHDTVNVHPQEAALTVDLCEVPTCDLSLLPSADDINVCEDTISTGFICNYLGVCDCETFLASPYVVGGCDGVLLGRGRNHSVTNFCAKHCGCRQNDEEEAMKVMVDKLQDRFKASYGKLCRYSTDDCQKYLSNLYSCSKGSNMDNIHPAVWKALEFQDGTRMALERAKLGNEALHRFDKNNINEKVQPCSGVSAVTDSFSASSIISEFEPMDDTSSSTHNLMLVHTFSIMFALLLTSFFFLVLR